MELSEPSTAAPAVRGSAVRLATEVVGRGLAFAATLLIARGLGPASYGTFVVLLGVALVAAESADLGLAGTAARTLADRSWRLRDLVRAKLALSSLVLIPATALGLAGAGNGPLHVLPMLMAAVVAVSWVEALGVALRSARWPVAEAAVVLAARAGLLAAVVGLGPGGARLEDYATATALAPLPALALAALLTARAYAGEPGGTRSIGAVVGEALPVGLATGLALVAYRIELWLMLPLRGAVETGLFGGALRAFDGLKLIPGAIAQGAMPYLVEESGARTAPAHERTVRNVVLLAAPAAVALFALAPQGVALLLGDAFAAAAGPVRLLALAVVPAFLNAFVQQALLAAGRAPEMPRLMALRLLASLSLGLLAIPAFGALGAAATCACAELLVLARGVFILRPMRAPLAAALRDALRGAAAMAVVLALLSTSPGLGLGLSLVAYVAVVARRARA
ncbi:MAG: hypothetical protein NDJ94_14665 [Vicinamibacteria bacterium]|nr:hypothetical protein [Vicinamibacteria bacterium]